MPESTESTATDQRRVFYYDPVKKQILTRKGQGEWAVVTNAVVVRLVTQQDDRGDPVVVSALVRDLDGLEFFITADPSGGQAVPATAPKPGEATPEEAQAKAPQGYRPVQNQSTGRWFYAPDPTKPPDQWQNPNPDRYEWVQESVSETNPDTGEPMEAQVRWVLQEKAATPASLQAEIDAALLAGDTKRAHDLYDQKQQLELQSPGFKKSREDKATEERRRQLEWNMDYAATQEEKDWAARQWTAEFGQRQWEASQQAQRDALRLGVDISRSPGDWWALENLRYGAQANRPYTGAEVAPRTWVDEWLKFAQQPQGTAPPVPRRITPPGFVPTYGQPAPPADGTPSFNPANKTEVLFRSPTGQIQSRPAATELELTQAGYQRLDDNGNPLPPLSATSKQTPPPDVPVEDLNIYPASGGTPSFTPPPTTDTRIEMQNEEGTTVFALPEEEEALTGQGFIKKKAGTLLDRAAPWLSRGRTAQAGRGVPGFGQPSALPPVPAQARFEAVHPQTKETAIISSNEIPGFNEAGFEIKKQVKLYDFLPYQMPGFGSGLASPLSRLPKQGVRQALFGQPVSLPRSWSTLGAPTTPSAQSWSRLPWEGKQIFQSEVERVGTPWESYAQEMASLWPSWGTPGRFRRLPTTMGFTGG